MKVLGKKMLSLTLGIIMLFSSIGAIGVLAEREYAAEVSILGSVVDFKNQPFAAYDTIFVPMEELCGYLNIKITKNADTFTINRGESVASFTVGNLIFTVDGKETQLTHQPVEKNGVVYVGVEFFSESFGIPVKISEDLRSADISANVYKVKITAENAAGVSAAAPDEDTLTAVENGTDPLYLNTALPGIEKAVYYKFDMKPFEGTAVKNVTLYFNASRTSGTSNTISLTRTAPWTKGDITYTKQPELYSKEVVKRTSPGTSVQLMDVDVTSLASNAMASGEELSLRIDAIVSAAKATDTRNQIVLRGVNGEKGAYLTITVDEWYDFPVKSAVAETEDKARYSEFELLRSLGVFKEDDEFPLDLTEGVQRQEFVRYALRLRNATIQKSGGEQFFSDVPTDSPFYNEIMTAHSMGLVSGWQGIAFRPYDKITLGEAITILGRILNYNIFADERGGFTPGYFAAARNGDLYNGAEIEKEMVSFKKMFKLLEDALDAKMLNVHTYLSNGTAHYTFDSSKTVLTEYWNAQPIEGQVTANEYSSLAGGSGNEGKIKINSKPLLLKFKPYNDFLGYNVKAYYDRYEDTLLYMGIKEYDVTEIDLADITSRSKSGNTVSFSYERENGRLVKESFTSDRSNKKYVIYNGKCVDSDLKVTATLLDADAGSIKLVNDNLTVITAYRTVLVSAVDMQEEVIYDVFDSYGRSLALKGKEYSLTDIKGKEILLEEIEKNDVISVAEDLDKNLVSAIVSKTKVTGAIEMSENAGTADAVYTIAGREYELCNTEIPAGKSKSWADALEVGMSSTFYINHEGRIAGTSENKTEGIIGYLLAMGDRGSAISKKLQVAVITKDAGEYVIYDLADKVEVDCLKFKKHEEIETYFLSNSVVKQPIIFDLNAEGKIKKINTPTRGYKDGNFVEAEEENLEHRYTKGEEVLKHKLGAIGKDGGADGDKQFFLGKGDGMIIAKMGEDFEDYYVRSSLTNGGNYNIDIYTIGKKTPEAVFAMYETGPSNPTHNNYLYVVDRIVNTYDSDGMEIKKLYYYDGVDSRKSVEVNPEYESAISGFNRGDIFHFSTDLEGRLHAANRYYDYENSSFVTAGLGSFYDQTRVSRGYIVDVEKDYVKLSSDQNLSSPTNTAWFDGSRFTNLMSYTADSAGVIIKQESVSTIRSYEDTQLNPQGMILLSYYETYRPNVWLVELGAPEGEGAYTVTYDKNADDAVTGMPTDNKRYNAGDSLTLPPAPSRVNHDFAGWKIGEAIHSPGYEYTISGNTTIIAQWIYNPTFEFKFIDEEYSYEPIVMNWALNDTNGNPVERNLPTSSDFAGKKKNHYLVAWDLNGTRYAPGAAYNPTTEGATFTAVWKEVWSGEAPTGDDIPAYNAETNTYSIATGNQLAWFSKNGGSANVILTDDIYLNGFFRTDGTFVENWYETEANITSANKWSTDYMIPSYSGTFDGKGHTIYGFYASNGDNQPAGLFTAIKTGGILKNVNLKGAYVVAADEGSSKSSSFVSIVSAQVTGGTIDTVAVGGKIGIAEGGYVNFIGSITARINGTASTIKNCTSDVYIDLHGMNTNPHGGNISKADSRGLGGIVGCNNIKNSVIENCVNNGEIYAPYYQKIGGIVGNVYAVTKITNCTNSAKITHAATVGTYGGAGKIVGYINSNRATITNPTEGGELVPFTAE